MEVEVFPVTLGVTNSYILKGHGTVLVDGGAPGKIKDFLKELKRVGIDPGEIGIVVLTHGHWDHIGSAAEIQKVTGARIAMHAAEKFQLEESRLVMPPGACLWGKVFGRILKFFLHLVKIAPAKVDIVLDRRDFSLKSYGIPGKIIHTPGHSPGSVSVILDTGEAFVGDLAMNALPMRIGPGLPIFGNDMEQVRMCWRRVLDMGGERIYPAHGKPFSAEVFRRKLARSS